MKHSLIDHVEFVVRAGNGGDGIVSFRREKFVPKGGPDGGDGGNGGSIYLEANPHVTTLLDFAGVDHFDAVPGERGKHKRQHGKDAEHLVLQVPVGTVVWQQDADESFSQIADLAVAGEKVLVARGGAGGHGNDYFKSSRNTTPMEREKGEWGEKKYLKLEMKVLADVGFVGLPNAGKSTLLSVLTAARPEIANYPFTTISPNLGVMEYEGGRLVLADIPGLIEDAHLGKGLGVDFLKHIERCRILMYVIAPTDADLGEFDVSQLLRQYQTVLHEVEAYGHDVSDKKALIVLNKIDILTSDQVSDVVSSFADQGIEILPVSAATTDGLEALRDALCRLA